VKIFVSYSRRDAGDFANQIHESLMDEHQVFTDVKNIQLGDVWSNTIEKNISSCDIFVVIVTHAALKSSEVEKEVLQAQKENKKIIPCIFRDIRKDSIRWGLEKIQGMKFTNEYQLARDLYPKIDIETNIPSDKGTDSIIGSTSKTMEDVETGAMTPTKSNVGIIEWKKDTLQPHPKVTKDDKIQSEYMDTDYLFKLGYAKLRDSTYDLSLAAFTKILKVKPRDSNALYGKAVSLTGLRKYEESLSFFDEALVMEPDNPEILIAKGVALRKLGKHSEAYNIFERITRMSDSKLPQFFPFNIFEKDIGTQKVAKFNYKELHNILSNQKKALSYWQKQVESIGLLKKQQSNDKEISEDIEPLNNVSHLLYKMGRGDEAATYLKRALEIHPKDVYALNTALSILQKAKIKKPPKTIPILPIHRKNQDRESYLDALKEYRDAEDYFLHEKYYMRIQEIANIVDLSTNRTKSTTTKSSKIKSHR
jgi:tetratricopeptide (TPR) repeat protein